MASFQTPASSAFAQQGSATDSPYQNSPRTSTSASHTNIAAYSNDHSTNNGLNAPLTLASPQLNPLPDFQRLSFGGATPRGEEPPSSIPPSHLAPPVGSQSPVVPDTPVSGYQSNTPALAPPQQEGWGTNRTSLAYLGEAPSSDGGHGDIEAREAQQAFEDEARAKDSENGHDQRTGEFGEGTVPSRSYADSSVGKRDEGLATISEAMLETSPGVSQPSTFPIPSPDVPSDVQPQSSIDSSIHEATKEAPAAQPQPIREYQPLRDSVLPPAPTSAPQPRPQSPAPPVEPASPRSPTTPIVASPPAHINPLPIPSPLHVPVPQSSSIPHFNPPPSGFEPRPITPRSASGNPRQPISIKPQAGTSLGSRHGDIVVAGPAPTPQFIPAASSPGLRGGDQTPASSGYFTPMGTMGGGSTPTGETGKRTISAGAFRRPGGGGAVPVSSSVQGVNVNGGRSFAPSGYNVVPIPGNPGFGHNPEDGPSDAEQIAQSWRSTAVPPQAYGGPVDDVPTPSFDTRPLQVNKNRMSMGGLPRPGTVP